MNRAVFWFYLSCLAVGSLLPAEQLPNAIAGVWDKAQHAAGYGLLTVLALRAFPRQATAVTGSAMWGVGAAIEMAQAATGWRHGDWADLLANTAGIAVALLLWRLWPSRWRAARSTAG